jgi:hypothetical protein
LKISRFRAGPLKQNQRLASCPQADAVVKSLCEGGSWANLSYANLGAANLGGSANLSRANLRGANLSRAHLRGANLSGANLGGAHLRDAHLSAANLSGAELAYANLSDANLGDADLSAANLSDADLRGANLRGANLRDANLTEAKLGRTIFGDVDLTSVTGLETCIHGGASAVDHLTLQKSGSLPLSFLRGVGLPDSLIEYLPSLLSQAIQHYSCFISYSAKDDEFAKRIHADLQNSGVRCWFAPHDLRIGDKIRDAIDAAIRLRDKLLLILSEYSIKSDWVENEVEQALEEERKRGQTVLFPLYIDEAWKDTNKTWAATIRRQRHIGDFRGWKDHDAYQQSFARVLRDLKPREVSPKVP